MGKFGGVPQWDGDFSAWEAVMHGCTTADIAALLGCTTRRIQALRADGSGGTMRATLSRADRIAMQAGLVHWHAQLAATM